MKLSQIREELVAQHRALRALVEHCRAAPPAQVRACVQSLIDSFRAHNVREESLLRGIVKRVDAWGPARAEIMDEEHVKEHLALYGALAFAGTTRPDKALDALIEHMDREEEAFLNADVLRDDEVLLDASGG